MTEPPQGAALGLPEVGPPRFDSVPAVRERLGEAGYLADEGIAAWSTWPTGWPSRCSSRDRRAPARRSWQSPWPRSRESRLIRLQCYEGLDESKALYEWNYRKQLLRIQADSGSAVAGSSKRTSSLRTSCSPARCSRPSGSDRAGGAPRRRGRPGGAGDRGALLEVLSEYQVSIPELGTVRANRMPMVFLTSNNTRELSEALKRRCLYLHIDYPRWSGSGPS